eukprot:CAMPEP_0184872400 /NCGR_PEP_ID=MMETSP0580-20130426/41270_1 /TAXON_ID=1118495 /ORGANISM="Dactyliosolen fragilissimus" /LENGTH=655 /DNA_ID=CAMNT_0027375197 /DNA_START=716 /DNA_END=2683 /DNA_ORIENTATION=+
MIMMTRSRLVSKLNPSRNIMSSSSTISRHAPRHTLKTRSLYHQNAPLAPSRSLLLGSHDDNNDDNNNDNQNHDKNQNQNPNIININNNNNNNYHQKLSKLHSSTTLSLAPMMEYTDRHFRHLVSLLSHKTLLYTEMVAANAIVHERQDSIQRSSSSSSSSQSLSSSHNHHPSSSPLMLLKSQQELDIQMHGYDMTYLRRFLGQSSLTHPSFPSSSQSQSSQSKSKSKSKSKPHDHPKKNTSTTNTVLQLGGSEPSQLREASQTVLQLTDRGYCDYLALNLNCGCPSPKVAGRGCFGAALMDDPHRVRDLVTSMHLGSEGRLPITVKCRIGTDCNHDGNTSDDNDNDNKQYGQLQHFIETVASSNVVTDFQIHARIAILGKKLSPADNRKIPPLKYHLVRRLVNDYPDLTFSLNGGLETIPDVQRELGDCPNLRGCMIGRSFAANPWHFAVADDLLYYPDLHDTTDECCNNYANHDNDNYNENNNKDNNYMVGKPQNRFEVLREYGKHADAEEALWDPIKIRRFLVKAIQPLFAGEPNAKRYRIALDAIAAMPKQDFQMNLNQNQNQNQDNKHCVQTPPISELIMNAAMEHLSDDVLYRSPMESYDRFLWEEERRKEKKVVVAHSLSSSSSSSSSTSQIVTEWQSLRKEEEDAQKN